MPARSSRLSSGAAVSPGNKKRSLDESQDDTVSPRRTKRVRSSVDYRISKSPSPVEASESRKPAKQLSENTKAKRTAKEIKAEEPYTEQDSKTTSYELKEEVGVKEEEEIITAKSTTKRKTKGERETEMSPLATRTKGLQMFVGAHVSAAKGSFNINSFGLCKYTDIQSVL
jgi:AP endonuclease 1